MAVHFSRRALLRSFPLPLALPAATSSADFQIGQLEIGDRFDARPGALERLLWEVKQRTSIEVRMAPVRVSPNTRAIFRFPFLFWGGSGDTGRLSEQAIVSLRRHLMSGGTLLVDNAEGVAGGPFDRRVRETIQRIFPRHPLARVPRDHVLHKSFYLVDHQAGRVLVSADLEAVQEGQRISLLYCQNDLLGAYARDGFGRYEHEVRPGGERQREMSFRLGINVVMYSLCVDYKDDLVHAPFILKRRR